MTMMELRKTFGFHTIPFTREIRAQDLLRFPFFDEAARGIKTCLENRMAAGRKRSLFGKERENRKRPSRNRSPLRRS